MANTFFPGASPVRLATLKTCVLKGLMLKLYQSADKAWQSQKKSVQHSEFRQIIKLAIDNIEFNQLSSQISKQENQPLVIH